MRGPFTWDARVGLYRDAGGRFVSRAAVRDAIDAVITSAAREVKALSVALRERRITLAAWQRGMAEQVKNTALAHTAAAKGGWAQMTQADFGRVGQYLAQGFGDTKTGQYQFLRNFAEDIANGRQPLNGRFLRRAEMYVEAGRSLYHQTERLEMQVRGFDEERNVLEPGAAHCEGCLAEDARGWVGLGELVPIGQRDCKSRDLCRIVYRNSVTGEESEGGMRRAA